MNELGEYSIALDGGFVNQIWSGTLENFNLIHDKYGDWQLEKNVEVEVSKDKSSLAAMCLIKSIQKVCAEASLIEKNLLAKLNIENLANQYVNEFLVQNRLSIVGETSADLGLDFDIDEGDPVINFEGSLSSKNTTLTYLTEFENKLIEVPLSVFEVDFSQDKVAKANIDIRFADDGAINADVETNKAITATNLDEVTIEGLANIFINDFSIIPAFLLPQITLSDGSMTLDARIQGNLLKPNLALDAELAQTTVEIIETGTTLSAIDLNIRTLSDFVLQMNGQAELGQGILTTTATIDYSDPSQLMGDVIVKGEQLTLANSSDTLVVGDVDISAILQKKLIDITGEVSIDEANIRFSQPAGVVKTSSDVILEGQEKSVSDFQQTLDIKLDLGDQTRLQANGFDGFLTGATRINKLAGGSLIGEGTISVKDAIFSIYSRELDIAKGEIYFTGNALENPEILLEANKVVDETTAGVRVSGRVKNPAVNLYSTPSMNDQDVLAFLVFEKNTESLGASDLLTLAQIANSFRGESNGRLSNIKTNLTKSLGLTEIEFGGSSSDPSVQLGKQFSSKFYLGYGYGVLSSIQTLLLRYNINKAWSVQSEIGEASGGDIRYRVEHN